MKSPRLGLKKHKEKLKDHKTPRLSKVLDEDDGTEEEVAVDAAEILKFEKGRKRSNG